MNYTRSLYFDHLDVVLREINNQSMSAITDLLSKNSQGADQGETNGDPYAKGMVAIISELVCLTKYLISYYSYWHSLTTPEIQQEEINTACQVESDEQT